MRNRMPMYARTAMPLLSAMSLLSNSAVVSAVLLNSVKAASAAFCLLLLLP